MISDELLKIVMNYNDITWMDENATKKLNLMIEDSISYFKRLTGRDYEYTKPGQARSLLLNRVMYARANALDDFEKNYHKEIVSFINRARVENAKEQKNESE